ncbi:MAG: alpha/beta fold hydrolase [Acidobacteriota bacterium]
MILERDGVALHVVEEGNGQPVVLLHGHSLDLRVWDDVAPSLAGEGFQVIRYDQRGHGRSSSPPAGYRWGDHAADLLGVIAAAGVRPAHVVGLSKGGGIALEATVRDSGAVRSLALVGPLVPDFPLSAELVASFRDVARAIREGGVQGALGRWLGHPLLASAHAMPGARERLEAMVRAFPAGEYFAQRDEPDREWLVTSRLGEIVAPTLIVSGARDVPDFAAMAALLSEHVSGAALEIVEECGHLVPLERPGQLAAMLVDHLRAAGD